mgnify:CR=1 FL=1
MKTTERKHWINAHQVRGNNRHFFTFSFGNVGVMLMNFTPFIELYKLVSSGFLSAIQREYLKKPCPHCGTGELHEVDGGDNEMHENYLWCNTCDLSMDSDGGYTC